MHVRLRCLAVPVFGIVSTFGFASSVVAAGNDFTFQGELRQAGVTQTGLCDLRFGLFDAASGGNQIGGTQTVSSLQLQDGLFTAILNSSDEFGPTPFNGSSRWLELAVRCPAGSGSFSAPFSPRQALLAAPYAQHAKQANTAAGLSCLGCVNSGHLSAGAVDGSKLADGAVTNAKIALNSIQPWKIVAGPEGSTLRSLNGTTFWDPSYVPTWTTVGNSQLNPSSNFLGTTDNVALELRVSNRRALLLQPTTIGSIKTGPNVIAGAAANSVASGVTSATIAGGGGIISDTSEGNKVLATAGTVGGGFSNTATGDTSTVAGGGNCNAKGVSSFVGGGISNVADGSNSVIAGGRLNATKNTYNTIGGGGTNETSGDYATVGGGYDNGATAISATVAGGYGNVASGGDASIGGGSFNTASGQYAMVPGGRANEAIGQSSFAAGIRARAFHKGSFVWADATDQSILFSAADNQFVARTSGGVVFFTNAAITTGVVLAAGGGSWSSVSDRNVKKNVSPVNGREVLEKVAATPVHTWSYESQADSIRHIGPMSQDFHASFGVGEDDRHITSVDADGVAFAAIQGLYDLVKEKDAQIAELKQRLARLETRLAAE